ncbi:Holliday junction branch migration protein RuvA [Patescibacteria group bacterium]|nr:Holliday junction branch migration protein RuvA [Patescibacteria group bacterium]
MIGSLRGTLIELGGNWVLLEVGGVGYRIQLSSSVLALLRVGQEQFFYIHEQLREDAHELYGFLSSQDLILFNKLLSVSGVGPKVAMTLLSLGSADAVQRAVMSGDLETLTSLPGVGKKTAQKIILELKGQLVEAEGVPSADRDVADALQGMGYSAAQVRDALKQIPSDLTDPSERIRAALRMLA